MENNYIDREIQQRILGNLVNGLIIDVRLENKVCKTEEDIRKFLPSLKDLVNRDMVDWHPSDKNTPKDESVPYGKCLRMYHIARPDFTELINYFKKLAIKIRSKFYH